jgi:hypothetical protein
MKKIYFYASIFLFLSTINLVSAQNRLKKNEFSLFTGVTQNSILFGLGNNLGLEAQHSFSQKIGIAASINVGNGYKNYADKYVKVKTFFYSTDKVELTFSPFRKGKWRFGAGLAHHYVPDVLFLGNVYPIDCPS